MEYGQSTLNHALNIITTKNRGFHNTLMILTFLLEDYTDKDIAEELNISQSTVRMNRKKYLKG